ncbi:MAG: hypothetical protein V1493_01650 [Candidatus Diapherotrites archaeon]
MKAMHFAVAGLFILLIVFSGCSDSQPDNTSNTTPGGGKGAGTQAVTPMSFLQCLKSKNVELYSTYWCNPCHENLMTIFSGTGNNLKFTSESEAETSFLFFKKQSNNIYKNSSSRGKCQSREYYFQKIGSYYALKFKETMLDASDCAPDSGPWPRWVTPQGTHSGITTIETLAAETGCQLP